ncbi:hypothetical protein [Streptomyces chryseus]|uniref:Uncharacterized protein n=1 Tax=Streptomyces chryseus TaxID=68186 RepID=A0ABQ3E5I9_9ACTN|nr:hypothetical protein [Streptomyces chryseus]GHB25769.1 hypothetical protein GCM10010346_56690 [Streptomyces chryseus]
MSAAPVPESLADPVLPHPSRLGLMLWFVLQWVLIPAEFVARIVWMVALVFGDGTDDMYLRPLDALARFLSPRKLLLRMSHRPAKHEAHLNREFARLSQECRQQSFSWRTYIHHQVRLVGLSDSGPEKCVDLPPREYRGVPLSVLTRLASAHHLDLDASSRLSDGMTVGLAQRKAL